MSNDGRELEDLVMHVERAFLPAGFAVEKRHRIYNDDGVQIAELDILIRGKVGTASHTWLIECRDRPGSGPAPGAWIEQLVGRRQLQNIDHVTAVSTTGFAPGAHTWAERGGIELRVVAELTESQFSPWLKEYSIPYRAKWTRLVHARLGLLPRDVRLHEPSIRAFFSAHPDIARLPLRSSVSGEELTVADAFTREAVTNEELFYRDLEPSAGWRQIPFWVQYPNPDNHYVIATTAGNLRVDYIKYLGEVSVQDKMLPLVKAEREYRPLNSDPISRHAKVAIQFPRGEVVNLQMHDLGPDKLVVVNQVPSGYEPAAN